ncbi:2-dehydropantoate 2-reductase [Rhodanobacter sp. MP1X3]|uniref:2-dehydropantoate 2-reductase n=1 Tax=Rhodanobacter sp. MP1X3 TaxID=2723086 RepID=UPI00161F1B50|nr:2-dehydropantoate 2-reductase [Rhodanobacter sp. MP1X3]MBB6243010.1 2-dehydropantoate 2-reductase [Rhodanobacter sp. MP1X3]
MRILILGAGGTGGYFGGRLAQAGLDVTFLVRPARAAQLDAHGLVIRSPLGDAQLVVRHLTTDQLPRAEPFDLILLSCKAYDLDSSIEAIAPAMGEHTTLLPILNGLHHYEALDQRFGAARVLGGLCFISVTKPDTGEVLHLGKPASVTFGERTGEPRSQRCAAIAAAFAQAKVEHKHSLTIEQDLWIKYSFLTALAAATCLMRASVGVIVATDGGRDFMEQLYAECVAVAATAGSPIPASARELALKNLTQDGSPVTASMLRDLESGQQIEGEQIVGDMLQRARAAAIDAPLLTVAWCHLQSYQKQRKV